MKINFNGNNSGKTKLIWLGLCLPRFWALHQQTAQHFHKRFIRKQSDSFLSHPEHTIWLSRHRTFRTQCLHMGCFFFESSIEITFKRVHGNDEDFFYQRNYIQKVRRNDVKILRNLVFNVFTKYPLQIDVNFTWGARWAGCCMWKYGVLVKVRESLLCVTNRCIKVTSKLILPSVSRFELHPYYKSKVKLIFV